MIKTDHFVILFILFYFKSTHEVLWARDKLLTNYFIVNNEHLSFSCLRLYFWSTTMKIRCKNHLSPTPLARHSTGKWWRTMDCLLYSGDSFLLKGEITNFCSFKTGLRGSCLLYIIFWDVDEPFQGPDKPGVSQIWWLQGLSLFPFKM